jgi:hypothetical protein
VKRFVVPPSWPVPPRRNWIPPKDWRPDPCWPPAPSGWRFWVDGKGKPVRGPIGRYGAPSPRVVYAGGAALVVFLGVNIWAASMIGVFGGSADDSAAVKFVQDSPSPTVAVSSKSPVVPRTVVTPPPTILKPSEVTSRPQRTTQHTTQHTSGPSASRTTVRPTVSPRPTRTTTRTATRPASPRPPRPTVRPSTRDEILRQYCLQQGIDPAWCDPANWPQHS